jgi:threonine/homoserine/homoserine lactone efflux protein
MSEAMAIFLRGLLIGLSIAAPVGPIGVLCIRRILAEGRLKGFLSGLGAASADMVYGAVAAFGLTVVADTLVNNTFWLRILGAYFLFRTFAYTGVKA